MLKKITKKAINPKIYETDGSKGVSFNVMLIKVLTGKFISC